MPAHYLYTAFTMIILIAESKTMLGCERTVDPATLDKHTPLGEQIAADIMKCMGELSAGELTEQTGLSATMASKMKKMIYDFPLKETGERAIEAYTGVVFKALDYPSLSEGGKQRCSSDVRIISSLYGWLRPEDIVKPYRLDFFTRLEEGPSAGKPLNLFWRAETTKALVREMENRGDKEILNLLPADAAKAIDWKLVKRFAKVWKVDFQEIADGGSGKTPNAGRLKTLRGTLLRQILEEDIRSTASLLHTSSSHYLCQGPVDYPDRLKFLC